jgi:hypothetical protein
MVPSLGTLRRSNPSGAKMRKFVLLAASAIMLAASVPVSAKVYQPCLLRKAAAWEKATQICIKAYEAVTLPEPNATAAAVGLINNMKNLPRSYVLWSISSDDKYEPAFHDCDRAILAAIDMCTWHDPSRSKAKYLNSNPGSVKRGGTGAPAGGFSLPAAGLLESTPGLTPQGPAAGGTPCRHTNVRTGC